MTEPYTAASQEAPAKRKLNDTDVAQEKRARRDTFDDDWAEFQRTVVAPSREPQPSYAHATISAEPELHATLTQDPKDVQSSETERRSHIEQATREDILARIEEEERAQEEAGERYVIHVKLLILSAYEYFARVSRESSKRGDVLATRLFQSHLPRNTMACVSWWSDTVPLASAFRPIESAGKQCMWAYTYL